MILQLEDTNTAGHVKNVLHELSQLGFEAKLVKFGWGTFIVVPSPLASSQVEPALRNFSGIKRICKVDGAVQLGSRLFQPETTKVQIGEDLSFGAKPVGVIAGPCAVESEEQIVATARAVARAGACALRGGAFKPRSSVYSFQGLGEEGIRLLRLARQETGLPIVSEVLDVETLDAHFDDIDVVQIGARNMQNFSLLRAAGEANKPVLLKRSMMGTIEEYLQAAEYILAMGNSQILLCERGIRTFETATRNSLDLNAVAVLKERTHLPVLVDPSHGTGAARYVPALSKAAIACGADGLLIEVHIDPSTALSDGNQSLTPDEFGALMTSLVPVAVAVERELKSPAHSVKKLGLGSGGRLWA
jgi:3-deoxy-7-phosphoheptulonate synthase